MSSRGTQFGRTMEYFRTADIDEARSALAAAERVVLERMQAAGVNKPQQRTRTRRTRSQVSDAAVARVAATVNAGL